MLLMVPVRQRHSMTNLYGKCTLVNVSLETLGVSKDATPDEINAAYSKLKEYFDPSKNSDPNIRIYFDDLTL